MATLNELHLQLEQKVQNFLQDESEENSSLLIAEIIRLLAMDAEVVIAGNPVEGQPGMTDPAGYYGPDGRFYFHVFTSRLRFNESGAEHPCMTKLKYLLDQAFSNETIGGLSLNYQKGKGTVVISKEDIMGALQKLASSGNS